MSETPTLIVIAKHPVAGRVKTRLCPPCTPSESAEIARAALDDTIAATATVRGVRRVLALDGPVDAWHRHGLDVIAQRGDGLADRIAAAFEDVGGPAFLVGMDTPQLRTVDFDDALAALADGREAVIGRASDGGYWGIGLRAPDDRVFHEIPMSVSSTYAAQRTRLEDLGCRIGELSEHRAVDTWSDAIAVAEIAPDTRFARAVRHVRAVEALAR